MNGCTACAMASSCLASREVGVGSAEPIGEHLDEAPEQLHRQYWLLLHQGHHVVPAHHHHPGGLGGAHGGAAGLVVDEPHLAEVSASPELGDLHAVLLHRHPPAHDDEELLARLTLGDDLAPAREGPRGGDGQDRRLLLVGEVLEERNAASGPRSGRWPRRPGRSAGPGRAPSRTTAVMLSLPPPAAGEVDQLLGEPVDRLLADSTA